MVRKRSPAYPSIGLEEAIERARLIHSHFNEHWAPIDAVADDLRTSTKSSGFLQMLGALKQFGLLNEKGSKENRQFQLTELALDILLHESDSEERAAAIQKAALEPGIHQELWDHFNGGLPPSDGSIRAYLLRQREQGTFNSAHVDSFISQFRESLSFAGLATEGIIGNGNSIRKDAQTNYAAMPMPSSISTIPTTPEPRAGGAVPTKPMTQDESPTFGIWPSKKVGMRDLPVTLPSLAIAVVTVPERMSELDFSTLLRTIEAWKAALVTTPSEPSVIVKPTE